MRIPMILSAASLVGVLALAGCEKKQEAAPPPPPTPQKAPEPPPAPEPAPIADEDLPVAADFEEMAEKEITAKNYSKELDGLEKEIQGGE